MATSLELMHATSSNHKGRESKAKSQAVLCSAARSPKRFNSLAQAACADQGTALCRGSREPQSRWACRGAREDKLPEHGPGGEQEDLSTANCWRRKRAATKGNALPLWKEKAEKLQSQLMHNICSSPARAELKERGQIREQAGQRDSKHRATLADKVSRYSWDMGNQQPVGPGRWGRRKNRIPGKGDFETRHRQQARRW